MSQQPPSSYEVADLIDFVTETIEANQGKNWHLDLAADADMGMVDATLKVAQAQRTNDRGHRMTISHVTKAKFRIGAKRKTVFRLD